MLDLASKKVYLFDLDDTLINTHQAKNLGLERAYQKLVSELASDFDRLPSFIEFEAELDKIYKTSKDENGKRFYDYDAKVFEVYCSDLSERGLKLKSHVFSLAARLCWHYRETKNNSLMAKPNAFAVLTKLRKINKIYCITEGKPNYQHTKAMLTDIESMVDSVLVTEDKLNELKGIVEEKNFNKLETVMVGDSETDIKAGKNAGIATICVRREDRDYKLFKTEADLTVSDLGELLRMLKSKT